MSAWGTSDDDTATCMFSILLARLRGAIIDGHHAL